MRPLGFAGLVARILRGGFFAKSPSGYRAGPGYIDPSGRNSEAWTADRYVEDRGPDRLAVG